MIAIIDADAVKYAAAVVGEKRTIVVHHPASGKEMPFANRTAFYGTNKKGGWLAERNAKRTSPFELDEFLIEDIQTAEPVEYALQTAKKSMERFLSLAGCKEYNAYVGVGDCFRVEKSTVLKYKGNRKDLLKPIHLEAITEYLIKKWKAKEVTGIEADDQCVIDCYGTDNILIGIDKDYFGCPVHYLNSNLGEVIDCDQFGELRLDDKGKVRGFGRIFQLFQIASGDSIDNYKANSASDIKWAEKGAYNVLKDCKTDADAWKALVGIYQMLYPNPKRITGWRGDIIEVDWYLMLQENYDMARMLTHPTDFDVQVKTKLSEFGVL
jgi:hypothetical protein